MLPRHSGTAWTDALAIFAARDRDDLVTEMVGAGVDPDSLNSAGSTALQDAILAEAANAIAALVGLGADVTVERDGLTATDLAEATGNDTILRLLDASGDAVNAIRLAIAARSGDLGRIEAFLAGGTDVNARDADGYTPVLHAALAGNMDAVALLAERGGRAEAASGDGLTALGVLVMSGDVEAVGEILSRGASADHRMSGIPVLSLAVVASDDAMVDLLLDRGADRTLESDDGATPGMLAMSLGLQELAGRLGGIPEPEPATDLVAAVVAGDAATVERLLQAGEDPDRRADNGMPAIVIAAGNGDFPTARALIDAGADVTAGDRNGNNAVHAALARTNGPSSGVLYVFLRRASEVGKLNSVLSMTNKDGRSAFVRLAGTRLSRGSGGINAILAGLPSLRAVAERPDRDGVSPMLAAVLGDNGEMLSVLAEIGVSLELPSGQGTAQDLARASQSWAALAALPDDRVVPEGFRKGATRSDKREMQRLLREWGYYPGEIDGIFGPGSRAALRKFLLDRDRELRAMAPHSESISHGDPVASEVGETDYWLRAFRTNCTWRIVEWKRNSTNSRFIGCVRADPEWNSHGFALVRTGTAQEELRFFGAGGWSDDVPIR
ncbi:MAG: hypothetical protein F4213_20965 [Boseongicola sp. SB0677_bin_26]|nr:hypothetical protein [Boseongicola sp. SB0665_bin_10]MYG28455.1 hypothetical protein [Boseongicola sp. SB0677_bin_26]